MRFYLLAAVAAAAIAAPAAAQTGPNVGADLGALMVQDDNVNYQGFQGDLDTTVDIDHKLGIDADIVAGYDFGMFRLEGELGYKRAKIDTDVFVPNAHFADEFGPFLDNNGGHARTVSAMVNGLVDFPIGGNFSAFAGAGAGYARTNYQLNALHFEGTDGNFAWQVLAGVRAAITPNLDLGLKYRYFDTKYNVEEGPVEEVLGHWRSHSLLASLTYNFGAAAPPPPPPPPPAPPPPPPPATQTCPDGTVILATDTCPVPPPPPPPPPPAPERG
jgi:opacity protein-like surface antigen